MKLLDKTFSFCPDCYELIPAKIVEEDGKVFMVKKHKNKNFKFLLENDAHFYRNLFLPFVSNNNGFYIGESFKEYRDKEFVNESIIQFFVTNKCNLKCPICYGKYSVRIEKDPSSEEIIKIAKRNIPKYYFALSGGEPTVREDLPEIIREVKKLGYRSVSLFTNGIKLTDFNYVKTLKEAGLDEVYLSFDSLREKDYLFFRGVKLLKIKMKALKNLKKAGIETHLFSVMKKGVNLDQIPKLIELAIKNNLEMVWFGALHEENPDTTQSDIMKVIMKEYGIPFEYFVEWRKLKYNVYKHRKFFNNWIGGEFLIDTYSFKINRNKIEPLLEVEELKKINKNLLRGVVKKELLSILLHRFDLRISHFLQKKSKIIRIWIGGIQSAKNYDLKRTGVFSFDENMYGIT